ncbi:centrobin isoform X2 [Sardina pilchardus]|uniref:centrobin isoform X2 n=1 Tax=Sardina pilchardus TaxID=27697 RepID=UPI002E0D3CC8
MSTDRVEDLLSDVEPLPSSPSPPPSLSKPWPLLSSLSPSSLARSWPSSPLSVLAASREVTARLYSSLQQSREHGATGEGVTRSLSELPIKPRQVSFKLSSASPEASQMWLDTTPPFAADRPEHTGEEEGSSLSTSISEVVGLTKTHADLGPELEVGQLVEEMSANLKTSLSHSNSLQSGRRHIEDMENLRSHLQTMLKTRPAERREAPQHSQQLQDDSFGSEATSHLLNAPLFPSVSPPFSMTGLEDLFPRYSRLHSERAPTPLPGETQVLKESLERERTRRKHCEQQLLSLQNRTLALQQQLALAISADRKKDIMIEQLDKTLAKVVEGWRRHEQDKSEGVKRLQEEKDAAERAHTKQQETLAEFEKCLSQAAEALDREQTLKEELEISNKELEKQVLELRTSVDQLREERQRLRAEVEETRSEAERLQLQTQASRAQLEQQREQSSRSLRELQEQLSQQARELETERLSGEQAQQRCEDLRARLKEEQEQLEEMRRERDAARVDRALDQARFEAEHSQLEVELKLSVEQQVTERLVHIQEENATGTSKLREQHRKQLLDLSSRHDREMSAQQTEFRAQLQEREDKLHTVTQQYDSKLSAMQEELVSMATCKRRLEHQRAELVSRLQGMMRSHWTEALRLLANQDQLEGPLSPHYLWERTGTHSFPVEENTTNCKQINTDSTHSTVPQAVVLHLSREREGGMRGEREMGAGGESDNTVFNHSHIFTPLEPQLDETGLTVLGNCDLELWQKVRGEEGDGGRRGKGGQERTDCAEREMTDRQQKREQQSHIHSTSEMLHPDPFQTPSQFKSLRQFHTSNQFQNSSQIQNLSHVHASDQFQNLSQLQTTTQFPGSSQASSQFQSSGQLQSLAEAESMGHSLAQNSRQKSQASSQDGPERGSRSRQPPAHFRAHSASESSSRLHTASQSLSQTEVSSSSPDQRANHSGFSSEVYSSDLERGPPVKHRSPPLKVKSMEGSSSLGQERQSELQYYITKLLDCSPGEPVLDAQVAALTQSTRGPSGALHSEPLSQLLTQPQANTQAMQHIQQLYNNLLRTEYEKNMAAVQSNLEQKLSKLEQREEAEPPQPCPVTDQRQPPQTTVTRVRKIGQGQGHRTGSAKVTAWR